MKKLSTIAALVLSSFSFYGQIINIPDANLKNTLLHQYCANLGDSTVDTNHDNEIQLSEAAAVIQLDISWHNITDIEGIQYFTNLKVLKCNRNLLSSIDVTALHALEELDCGANPMNYIMVNNLPHLKKLNCNHCNLNSIDLSGLTELEDLQLYENAITSLDFSATPNLVTVWCSSNQLTELNIPNQSHLLYLWCNTNQINNLNIEGTTHIKELDCAINQLTTINTSLLTEVIWFYCNENQIPVIDLLPMTSLSQLNCGNNLLTQIDVAGLINLNSLGINATLVSTIDCSQSGVQQLSCSDNPNLTAINVRNNYFSYSDPDMLYFAFFFENLPLLTSICMDDGEQDQLIYTNYNTSGNVQIFGGENCDIQLHISTNSTSDFDLNNQIVLYPNPVNHEITVECKAAVSPQSIVIYNTLGQLIKTVPFSNASKTKTLDVTPLTSGTYFIEINSNQGKATKKFVKI